ncbi:MAG: hypothetical protein ACE5DR_05515, partial [Thermodesulfobacteriota bacterium]
ASFTETSSSDQTNVNLGDRKVLRYTTNLSYYRKFSRVNLNTSYGLGYLWETERTSAVSNNDDGGQGITHNGSLSLNSIDFNRFFLFNTGASFRDVLKSTAGKLTDKSHRYYMNFDNRFWTNVFTLRGSYEKENSTDAIDEIKESEEVSRISVTSSPIKGGRLTFGVQRRVYFTDLVGRSTSNSGDVSAGYGHTLFGGSFGTSASYSLGRDTFEGGDSSRRTYSHFNFSYERSLLWRVLWKFNTDLTNISVDDTFSRSYAFTNSLFYRLRAWSLSLDHSYTISQTSTTDNRVNKIFLRVGRQFLRMF